MGKLNQLTLTQFLTGISQKKFSLAEVYTDIDRAIESAKPLNIYLTTNSKAASQASQQLDKPLLGAPIAVKDNYCTQNLRTTAASKVLDKFVPQYESTVTNKLQTAGGVVLGKTNMDAWAHGSSTETSQYGRTLNPRNPKYLPGGSSGGSAAAVAADASIASLGTETAGSIRQPAAWCGVVGLKPTYGRVSRAGVVAMASSTDSPGPITKTVEDAAIILNHIAGHDIYDGTSSPRSVPDFTDSLGQSIKGLKIGITYQNLDELRASFDQIQPAIDILSQLGAKVTTTTAMDPKYAIGVYTIIQRGEVSSNLARYQGVRYSQSRSEFGDEAKRRVLLGTFTLSSGYSEQYYQTAQKVRTLFLKDYQKLFDKFDVLISLTSPGLAKEIGASETSPMFGELEDMLVEPSSITGLPGINLPVYRDPKTNLFLGMNIIAPMWREDLVIQVASALESNSDWNTWQ